MTDYSVAGLKTYKFQLLGLVFSHICLYYWVQGRLARLFYFWIFIDCSNYYVFWKLCSILFTIMMSFIIITNFHYYMKVFLWGTAPTISTEPISNTGPKDTVRNFSVWDEWYRSCFIFLELTDSGHYCYRYEVDKAYRWGRNMILILDGVLCNIYLNRIVKLAGQCFYWICYSLLKLCLSCSDSRVRMTRAGKVSMLLTLAQASLSSTNR